MLAFTKAKPMKIFGASCRSGSTAIQVRVAQKVGRMVRTVVFRLLGSLHHLRLCDEAVRLILLPLLFPPLKPNAM